MSYVHKIYGLHLFSSINMMSVRTSWNERVLEQFLAEQQKCDFTLFGSSPLCQGLLPGA